MHVEESKSAFARRTNVSPARVTQWVAEGKIKPDALVGTGRGAKINVTRALEHLDRNLDVDQRNGVGLKTRLRMPTEAAAAKTAPAAPAPIIPPPAPVLDAADTVAEQIMREKLEALQRQNRTQRREESVAAGELVSTDDARKQAAKLASALVSVFDGALSDFATALAGQFKIPQRDVLHLLRTEFRKVRATASDTLRRQAASMPMTTRYEIADDGIADAA